MEEKLFKAISLAASQYGTKLEAHMLYGTAGFRAISSKLPLVCFRVGLLAALLAKKRNSPVGILL